jgi:phosphoadenosine phosphosulfate reductase
MTVFDKHLKTVSERLAKYREGGLSLFATSSFQTNSVVLLHTLSVADPSVPVYFLNTGYHFPETLSFRADLARRFGLEVIDVFSHMPRAQQRDAQGRLLFASDPDRCCDLNKIQPLEAVLIKNDVWISGVRSGQSANRGAMSEEEPSRHGVTRYHPLLEWSATMIDAYIDHFELPRHPLEAHGYQSVGCQPCTRKIDPDAQYDDRTGRWFGLKKTECGIHLGPKEDQ